MINTNPCSRPPPLPPIPKVLLTQRHPAAGRGAIMPRAFLVKHTGRKRELMPEEVSTQLEVPDDGCTPLNLDLKSIPPSGGSPHNNPGKYLKYIYLLIVVYNTLRNMKIIQTGITSNVNNNSSCDRLNDSSLVWCRILYLVQMEKIIV